jgi:L-lactate utilization protein LutC
MKLSTKWSKLADRETIDRTIEALTRNGIEALYFDSIEEAKDELWNILPENSEVMTMTSQTTAESSISEKINNSGEYESVREKLASMNREKEHREMQRLGAAPEYAIGSVHAVTEDGNLVIASNTGSQLPAYAYGADKVIFVIGTQKIVKNLDEAFKRVYEHSLPLESERAKKAYGTEGSSVNKILIINKEIIAQRIKVIFINKLLGF